MEKEDYERFTAHLAKALNEFGKIPAGRQLPTNAVTLWHHIIEGFGRVSDALTKPPEK